MTRSRDTDLSSLFRSAGVLGAGRQVGSLVFMGSVLLLPRLAARPVVDDFIWAYFAALFLSSILNLGLERVVGPAVAQRKGAALGATLRPVLSARLYTAPATAVALWILYRFVGVTMPAGAWAFSLLWVVAVQVQGVAFAGLRAGDRPRLEPRLALISRLVESVLLLGLAAGGASVTALVASVAVVETVTAMLAVRALGPVVVRPGDEVGPLPWKTLSMYAGVELLAFAYLRVDMALVGNLLGPGVGATYGLMYRVIDALTGLGTPVLLLLYPYASRLVFDGRSLLELRERVFRIVPAAAVLVALAVLASTPLVAVLVPRLGEGVDALRLLLVAVPLSLVSAVELHLRSAEGRNAGVLAIGAGVLTANVVLNLYLVPRHGLEGAAWALLVTETLQLVAIMVLYPTEGGTVRRWGIVTLGMSALLTAVALLVNAGRPDGAALVACVLTAMTVAALRRRQPRAVAVCP